MITASRNNFDYWNVLIGPLFLLDNPIADNGFKIIDFDGGSSTHS